MLKTSKRANINVLQMIAFGIITLAIIVGIGLTIGDKLADTQAVCAEDYTYDTATNYCLNATGEDPTTPTGSAFTSITYANTQLGSTGLLSWLPAVIALLVGVFFLFYFMGGRQKKY